MRGHAAARGEDGLRGVHAANVLRAGLDAHQNHLAPLAGELHRLLGAKHDLAASRAGRGGEAAGQNGVSDLGVDGRMQQLVERGRVDSHQGVVARDEPFVRHIDRDLQRGRRGALAAARLQHP